MNGTAVDPSAGARPDRRSVGAAGEVATLRRYLDTGYELVARNWRCPIGEIDLILSRVGLLVFCEVKTRLGAGLGGGYEAVTWRKQRKLRQLAEVFLLTRRVDPSRIRFDVASVIAGPGHAMSVELFEDAF
jgi:putative endonuclease